MVYLGEEAVDLRERAPTNRSSPRNAASSPASSMPMRGSLASRCSNAGGCPFASPAPPSSACSLIASWAPLATGAALHRLHQHRRGGQEGRRPVAFGGDNLLKDLQFDEDRRERLEQPVDREHRVRQGDPRARPSTTRRPRSTGPRRARRTSPDSPPGCARKPLIRSQLREFILCGMADEPTWPSWKPSTARSWPAIRRNVVAEAARARPRAGTPPPRPRSRSCADTPAPPLPSTASKPSSRASSPLQRIDLAGVAAE